MATSSRAAVPLRLLFVILAAGYATIGLLVGRTVGRSVGTGLFFASLVTGWYVLRRWWRTTHARAAPAGKGPRFGEEAGLGRPAGERTQQEQP